MELFAMLSLSFLGGIFLLLGHLDPTNPRNVEKYKRERAAKRAAMERRFGGD